MSWLDNAGCAGDLHFTERPATAQARVCHGCPVTTECMKHAVTIWDDTPDYAGRVGLAQSPVRFAGWSIPALAEAPWT